MPQKQFILDGHIPLIVSKRASSRRIRLSIGSDGKVRASIPRWLPYSAATEFAASKADWIKKRLPEPTVLKPERRVGKNHVLVFKQTDTNKVTTRLSDLEAVVFYPKGLKISDPKVQEAGKRVIRKALQAQAGSLLPIRLKELALKYGYSYKSLRIKSLKTRWGSCDNHQNITLNLYLMELPWDLIDYVLLHELNHTVVMAHGPRFWQALEKNVPNHKELRKKLKSYPTMI